VRQITVGVVAPAYVNVPLWVAHGISVPLEAAFDYSALDQT
jgi:hypothetical protein